ncbi:MAG: sugar O-acetyltransferase, partial [Aeromonas sobria]
MSEVMTKATAVVRGPEWQKMVAGEPYDAGDPA